MPVVSVLMTVFNRAHFLPDAVESVLASSFTDFELIISDDCSTDGSWELAQKLAGNDKRLRLHRNETNLGDYGNRMQSASLATGEFIKYVDSDDLIYPHGLEVMVCNMRQHPSAALALAHSAPEELQPYPILQTPEETYRRHFLGRGSLGCGPGGAIIRREVFNELGGFHPEWGVLADLEFWQRAAAQYSILLQQPALVWWRQHEGQEFRIGDAERVYLIRGYELSRKALLEMKCPLNDEQRAQALKLLQKRFFRSLLRIGVKQRQPSAALKLFRESELTAAEAVRALI
jgi:glycosyltransferase involved in cell wall biosynthesis